MRKNTKLETQNPILEHEPLARYTSWRIGGPARWFGVAASADELAGLVAWGRERELPVFVLGGGSNVLLADGGFNGLVIRNRAAAQRIDEREGELLLWTEAGAPTAGTARRLAAQGYGGLVWAEGLPGTIGGAIYGNAGCYGGDTAKQLVRAWVLRDGEVEAWPVERFGYGYRTSILKGGDGKTERQRDGETGNQANQQTNKPTNQRAKDPQATSGPDELENLKLMYGRSKRPGTSDEDTEAAGRLLRPYLKLGRQLDTRNSTLETPIVLAAELRLTRGDPQVLRAEMAAIAEQRKGKTPAGSSCGSVFKNPPGTTAGTLLDQAGLKGTHAGGAIVSEKHANYIVNRGDATAADVLRLAGIMRERVLAVFGVELELEVQLVGEQP